MIVREAQLSPALPRVAVLEDQIVWGRSPVRLDLAGGWTDTPPYCLEYGGQVRERGGGPERPAAHPGLRQALSAPGARAALDRPGRRAARPHLRGTGHLRASPGSEFALAKAALALAGFLPRFHARPRLRLPGGAVAGLRRRHRSVACFAPCPRAPAWAPAASSPPPCWPRWATCAGSNWDRTVLFTRTLALEQMLTTGGGWQDQAGGIFRGVKLIETGARPGAEAGAALAARSRSSGRDATPTGPSCSTTPASPAWRRTSCRRSCAACS